MKVVSKLNVQTIPFVSHFSDQPACALCSKKYVNSLSLEGYFIK